MQNKKNIRPSTSKCSLTPYLAVMWWTTVFRPGNSVGKSQHLSRGPTAHAQVDRYTLITLYFYNPDFQLKKKLFPTRLTTCTYYSRVKYNTDHYLTLYSHHSIGWQLHIPIAVWNSVQFWPGTGLRWKKGKLTYIHSSLNLSANR